MAFADTRDVATRLGRTLTEAEDGQATFLLEAASAVIADASGRAEQAIRPVPTILRFVAVEMVCRAFDNPGALASWTEALGAHSRTERYRDGDGGGGLWLTERETLLVRRAVLGRLSGTSLQESIATDADVLSGIAPATYGRLAFDENIGS